MGRKSKIAIIVCACIFFSAAGIYLGYMNMREVGYESDVDIQVANLIVEVESNKEEDINLARINSGTRIVYEHYDINTGSIQVLEAQAPNFMIRKSQQDIEQTFSEWDVVSFTDEEVVMRRHVENRSARLYTLGIEGDFIAIFNGGNVGINLNEITDIYIGRLPQEEIDRLVEGVPIYSQDELIRRLEDYSS